MGLDLSRTARHIDSMAGRLHDGAADQAGRLTRARAVLHAQDALLDGLREKLKRGGDKVKFRVAGLSDGLAARHAAPSAPSDYVALGADGSQIEADRHTPAACFLLNIGTVSLRYGAAPGASLDSVPLLLADAADLEVRDPSSSRSERLEGPLLGVRRAIEEHKALLELARRAPPELPVVALLDGSLVLWTLAEQAYPEFVRETLLDKALLPVLDEFAALARSRPLALASYISYPRSTDVVNALRVAECPYAPPDCDRHCSGMGAFQRKCDKVGGVLDRDLFSGLLAPGERSALFDITSKIVQRYGRHAVRFFYLNVGNEIARVEMPQWVADSPRLLDLAHGLALDQCRRGRGYPVSLSEAHEQAVVHEPDRQQFWHLVENALARRGMRSDTSAKNVSKRTRWL
ncbi:MAG: DNA double-strand break repair nuclease NurA [Dehalococcoidia bacterium]|nr:DNA double-strand break repair nuclease NurA [Dehalococcoidia bacterium]